MSSRRRNRAARTPSSAQNCPASPCAAKGIDIFGLQESGGKRVGATTKAIWSGGKQGFVRADGGAKARYIFYRRELFSQVSGGSFPIGDGRYATWAHMRTKESTRDFFYVDVHLEGGHGSDGKRAAGMVDSVDATTSDPVNANINSGHTFSTNVLRSGDYVDHIFVSSDIDVLNWEQLVRISNGRYTTPIVSDHNALKAVVPLEVPVGKIGAATLTTAIPGDDLTLR